MKKVRRNKIDLLIENLSVEFSKIPNFELTQTDTDANRLFNFIIIRFSEIQDFKSLYQGYFIPSTNKAIADARNEIRASFYRKSLNVSDSQLKENYYDTIRLGYVGLFHKIENYVKDLLVEANQLFNEGKSGDDSIEKFYEKNYKFKFTDWYADLWINKINWICNCVKHYDGYPKKEPKYKYLNHLPENEKIRINHDEFYKDIDYVVNTFYHLKLAQVFTLSLFKMVTDSKNDDILNDELKEKYLDLERQMKQLM
ncbi:MAG: hypothetical protein Q8928_07025 [Bacteroidota bacterium]|nr:hypothetical protein [Bacteroidota bacterium]